MGAGSRFHLFADESGNFDFSRKEGASRYYVICTVVMEECSAGARLLDLRRQLLWERAPIGHAFHATEEKQAVRDRVFELIANENFTVQATIMEKAKAQPHIRAYNHLFYKFGWFYHMGYSTDAYIRRCRELIVTTASIKTKRSQVDFDDAVRGVLRQRLTWTNYRFVSCPAASDPCLQIADYCSWAIQRKWERADLRSYNLIKDRITYEYELWSHGRTYYY